MGFLLSSFILVAEFFVLMLIGHIVYSGYHKGWLSSKLLFFTLAYEIVFNVGYMVIRTANPSSAGGSESVKLLGMFHGIFSLLMFVVAVAFFILAYRQYKKGINYFKEHKTATILFCACWIIALFSGVALYLLIYF